jgi:hypothetical protein
MAKETSRLEALEAAFEEQSAKTAALESELAALKAQQNTPPAPAKIAPKPVEPEGTTVFYPPPRSDFVMPSSDELKRLREIVLRKFPKLAPDITDRWADNNEAKFARQFDAAFKALGAMHRADKPDKKRYVSFFVDHAEDSLKALGAYADIGPAFLPACLAHGDIPISDWRIDGVVLELGLNIYRIGRPATDAWRRVLATGNMTPLIAPPSTRNYPTLGVRIGSVA